MTDYVNPKELLQEAVQLAKRKSDLPARDMLIRGILAGAFLGYATSLAIVVTSQGLPPIVGAILFPVGFVILALLGLELVTGNFALLPAGIMAGTVRITKLLRNWGWVYLGNLIGSVLYAALFYLAITNWRTGNGGAVADLLKQAAQKKTLAYAALGYSGWGTAVVKAVLCNWMVTIGAMLAMASRSTAGKITASHPDFLCARLRAFRRQHVRNPLRHDAWRAHLSGPGASLELASRHPRKYFCRRAFDGHSVVCNLSSRGCSCCKRGRRADSCAKRTTSRIRGGRWFALNSLVRFLIACY
jgi:formate/nitrite transporter FocA (FNT family)